MVREKSKNSQNSKKIKRVTEYLQNALLPLPYGGQLPGIRTIMKQTGAGQISVTHVLRLLEQRGLIRIAPYRGIFRTDPRGKSNEIRLLHWTLSSLDESGFLSLLFESLQELAAQDGRKIIVENVGRRTKEAIAEELNRSGVSSCIISSARSAEFSEYLCRRMKICLELLPRHVERVTTELRDSPEMTDVQMNYLLKRGYRRIGYFHFCQKDISIYPIQVLRLMDYYRLMAENGLKVNPDWVFYCSERYANLGTGMNQIMKSVPKPEVLIVPGSALPGIYAWCRRHQVRPGSDLAIFSIDDINSKLSPEPTAITNNPMEIAQIFWQMFRAAESGEKVRSTYTKLFIRTGKTVPSLTAKS